MARTEIPILTLGALGGSLMPDESINWTAGDSANGMYFNNPSGSIMLLMKNVGAGGLTATVVSVPDPYNREKDLTITCPLTSGFSVYGPFMPALFNQSDGTVHVDSADLTDCSFAAIQIST